MMQYIRSLKSCRYGQHNLAHGTETKNEEKLKTKTLEETVWAIVHEESLEGMSERMGEKICETCRF